MYEQGLYSGPDMVEIRRKGEGEKETPERKHPEQVMVHTVYSIYSRNVHRDHDETWIR